MTQTMWPTRLKIFTTGHLQKNFADPCHRLLGCGHYQMNQPSTCMGRTGNSIRWLEALLKKLVS